LAPLKKTPKCYSVSWTVDWIHERSGTTFRRRQKTKGADGTLCVEKLITPLTSILSLRERRGKANYFMFSTA